MKNIENGIFKLDRNSPHNVPMITVRKKDGRVRSAYNLRKLNDHTKDVESHIPSYNYLFEKIRGPGLITVADQKNFFENIPLRKKDRPLTCITTPLGRYHLTRASFGFKKIPTLAQQITD